MAYRVLIVDDDIELLKMLKNYFEIKQYDVMTAGDGAEALEKINKNPDIILLDINMPKIDGLEVCKQPLSAASRAAFPGQSGPY